MTIERWNPEQPISRQGASARGAIANLEVTCRRLDALAAKALLRQAA